MGLIDSAEQATRGRLWLIGGVFEEQSGIYSFGGWFRQGGVLEREIRGKLVDEGGESEIMGTFDPEQYLKFDKTYPKIHDSFKYELRFENGLWLGEFKGQCPRDYRKGPIEAIVTPISSTPRCLLG